MNETDRTPRHSKRRQAAIISGVVIATAAISGASSFAGGSALGAISSTFRSPVASTSTHTKISKLGQPDTGSLPFGGWSGFGDVPGAGSGQNPDSGQYPGSGQASGGGQGPGSASGNSGATTAATPAEEVGVVDIVSDLSYDQAEAAGTGIVLTSSGEILTNNHVVEDSTSISVTIVSTGATYVASVVGTDATDDVAVLQLSHAAGLHVADVDRTPRASVGDAVTGVGNAGGKGSTPSAAAGTVVATDQTITTQAEESAASETLNGLIETNADIQAGDSGGPLYNADGEIVGMDTAAEMGGTQTEGYAIPVSSALSIAKKIESGQASAVIALGYPAFLGVEVAATADAGAGYGDSPSPSVQGAAVEGVLAGTPAASAGLIAGDTITAVNGRTIDSSTALRAALAGYTPGQRVTLAWADSAGASHTATVTLVNGPVA